MHASLYCRHASDLEAISSKEQQLAWFAQPADRYLCHNQRLSRCRAVAMAVRGFALKQAVAVGFCAAVNRLGLPLGQQ